jgi:predicted neuraminidase
MFHIYDLFEPQLTGHDSHGSSITELPNGDVMAAWYSGTAEKHPDVAIYTNRFIPSMKAITKPVVLEKANERTSEGNPVIYYDPLTKRLWLFWVTMDRAGRGGGWSTCRIKCKHSVDLGKSWSKVHYLTHFWGRMTRYKPVRLSNGDVILPIYSEWLNYKANFLITTAHSFAQDSSLCRWRKVGPVGNNLLQPSLVELDDRPGHLLAYCRTARHGTHKGWTSVIESFNYGNRWTRARRGSLPNPNSGCDLVKLRNGYLVLAFNNSPSIRSPLSIALSEDSGKTWPYIRDLERDDKERFSYPSLIQYSDGTLFCSYTNKKGINIRLAQFDEAWIRGNE